MLRFTDAASIFLFRLELNSDGVSLGVTNETLWHVSTLLFDNTASLLDGVGVSMV